MDPDNPVRSLREKAGISQAELARRLDVNQSRVVRLEQQGSEVKLSTLRRVAEACGLDLETAMTEQS